MAEDNKEEKQEKQDATPEQSVATEQEKEVTPKTKGERSTNAVFKMYFLIMVVVVVVLIVIATVVKIALTREAMQSQDKYEQICVLLKGELAISKTFDGIMLDCVSGMDIFTTPDGMALCNKDEDCEGACVGDFTADVDYQGACSNGIRLLPRFIER